jgi:hypothetical protein
MPDEIRNDSDFREKLFSAQEMSPILRDTYRRELDAIVHETPTARSRLFAIILLVICLGVVAGEIRAMIIYRGHPAFYLGAATMLIACATVAFWIVRDLFRAKVPRKGVYRVSEMFYGAAWILVVVQLLRGLSAPSDPASTFGVLFVFTFAAVCTNWSFANRITAAELASKEQLLRLECRLADLAEHLRKP